MSKVEDELEAARESLAELIDQQKDVQRQLDNWEVDSDDLTDDYDNMLDECYGTVEVCGMTFDSRRILQELDPTAYHCGFIDFIDGLEKDPQSNRHHPAWQSYRDLEEELETLEDELVDQEEQLEELEEQLELEQDEEQ